jgi:hypothetical protein
MVLNSLKLTDNQELKIMPIIRKDDSQCFAIPVSALYHRDKMILDERDFLSRLYNSKRGTDETLGYTRKYLLSVWYENKFHMVLVGKSIHDIIIEELSKGSYEFRDNKHLKIVSKMITPLAGIGPFVDYKSSHFIDLEWDKPVNTKEEWVDFIKKNQFDFDEFLVKSSVMYNLNFLNKEFDNFFSFLISDMRDKKLEQIGI